MPLKISDRGAVPPFIVMDVLRAANQRQAEGRDVLHLELGQPATSAPQGVIAAAKRAIDTDPIGYTEAFGLPELRQRIAGWYKSEYDVDVPTDRIVVTTGSSAGFVLAFLSAFDAGDRIALADPGYPGYRNILHSLNVTPVGLAASQETRFQPVPEMLDGEKDALDGLIVASPSNPAGTMISAPELERLADACREREIRLISDEIYHGICYGEPGETALKFDQRSIIISSFSKYFSMTGWRIGWMVVPEELLRSVECLAQNIYISAPTLSQLAAIAAFDCREELDRNVARYAANRTVLLDGLSEIGLNRRAPADGAFYVYADVGDLTNDSEAFCRTLLNETGVAITPGIDFDPGRGNRYIRLSFSGATGDIEKAVERMGDWLSRYR